MFLSALQTKIDFDQAEKGCCVQLKVTFDACGLDADTSRQIL